MNEFTKPPDFEKWQDIAFAVGLTPEEAQNSYDNFEANDWKRGNKIELESWRQIPALLRYWRNNRQNFTPRAGHAKQPFDCQGHYCSAKTDGKKCGQPTMYKYVSDFGMDYYRCESHKRKGEL